MYFKHPEFLYGLLAVLIPVIIHLFNFRRYKKLWFSNIEFLKNITAQTRKQNKLKHLIVLLFRMLAVALIVLAFAGPELNNRRGRVEPEAGLAVIYIDNSFSMMAQGENGRLFEEAVNQARELVTNAPRDKRFVLLANEVSPSMRRVLSKEEMVNELDGLAVTPAARELNAVIASAGSITDEKKFPAYDMYLFSDFPKNTLSPNQMGKDTTAFYYLFPMTHLQQRNLYIDTCLLSAPVMIKGRNTTLKVRLQSSSDADYEKIPLKLIVNGQQQAVAGVDVKAGGSEWVTMNFKPRAAGWYYGLVEIEDYPITFDDKLYFAFYVEKHLNVLEIGEEKQSDALAMFYGSDSLFRFQKMDYRRVQFDKLNNFNLIILNSVPSISNGLAGQLKAVAESGTNVLFIPSENGNHIDENHLLQVFGAGTLGSDVADQSRIVGIKTTDPLFSEAINKVPENADLPIVQKHYRYAYGVASGIESLLTLLDGDDFLLAKKAGKGRFYMLAAPLGEDWGNFAVHALFVPVMYGAAVAGDAHKQLFYVMGEDERVRLNGLSQLQGSDNTWLIKAHGGDYSFIPGQQMVNNTWLIDLHNGIKQAGFYDLITEEITEFVLAYNYNRSESHLDFYSGEELNELIEKEGVKNAEVLSAGMSGYKEMINTVQQESQLWKLFIIFALLMLLSEILVLRFWK